MKFDIIANIISIVELVLLIAAIVAHPAFMVAFVIIFSGELIWCDREEKKEIKLNKEETQNL